MTIEKVEEVPFIIRKRQRGKLGEYWAIMGYLFQIVRDIDPKLKYAIDTFTLIGILWTTKTLFSLFGSAFVGFRVFIWSRLIKLNLRRLYGQYVVVTGATDGIGLEFAKEFAKRGHSLIITGRSKEKLERTRLTLTQFTSIDNIVTVLADFNSDDPNLYKEIAEQLKPYRNEIGILVNNAGVMHESPNRYMDQSEEGIWQHVRVNMLAVLMMTRAVLPGMIARRRGLIVNMSSIAGYEPLPLMGVYSASKKFVEYFGRTLDYEYSKSHNIHVQTLVPSYISTKMVNWSNMLQKPNFLTPTAASFAQSAIATIGRSNHTTGYWSHGLEWFLTDRFVPRWLYNLFSWNLLRTIDSTGRGTQVG